MADWTNITDSQVDPDAPLTSEIAYAWRDNPIAIAEGAVGAPKVEAIANRATTVTSWVTSSTNYYAATGLGRVASFRLVAMFAGAANSTQLQVSFSTNGGSTWGANQDVVSIASNQGLIYDGYFNLMNGSVDAAGQIPPEGSSGATNPTLATSVTVPSGVNAFRFRMSAARAGRAYLEITGGRP